MAHSVKHRHSKTNSPLPYLERIDGIKRSGWSQMRFDCVIMCHALVCIQGGLCKLLASCQDLLYLSKKTYFKIEVESNQSLHVIAFKLRGLRLAQFATSASSIFLKSIQNQTEDHKVSHRFVQSQKSVAVVSPLPQISGPWRWQARLAVRKIVFFSHRKVKPPTLPKLNDFKL